VKPEPDLDPEKLSEHGTRTYLLMLTRLKINQ